VLKQQLDVVNLGSYNPASLSGFSGVGPYPVYDRFVVKKIPYYKTDHLSCTAYPNTNLDVNYPPWINVRYDNVTWGTYDNGRGYAYASFTTQEPGFLEFNLNINPSNVGSNVNQVHETAPTGSWIRLYCLNDILENEADVTDTDKSNNSFYTTIINSTKANATTKVEPSDTAKKFFKNYDKYLLLASSQILATGIGMNNIVNLSWSGWVQAYTKFVIVCRAYTVIPAYINDTVKETEQITGETKNYLYYTLYTPIYKERSNLIK
jgi:hypothetical protein